MFRMCMSRSSPKDRSILWDDDEDGETIFPWNQSKRHLQKSKLGDKKQVLVEIVGAMGLSGLCQNHEYDMDTFCVVSRLDSGEIIHRTKTITRDTDPIWTIKTRSVCLVEWYESKNGNQESLQGGIRIELCRANPIVDITNLAGRRHVLGSVKLTYASLLGGTSERLEYAIAPNEHPQALLALRFRPATPPDEETLRDLYESPSELNAALASIPGGKKISPRRPGQKDSDNAGDIDFHKVSAKHLLGKNHTTVELHGIKQKAYRVWPFPDPDQPKATTFLTKDQIRKAAMRPSKAWVEAAGGADDNYGSIFLEILGCDDLPNMDTELVDGLTDAFVGCVYEDNFVRTAVIHDSLHPRWLPWAHRAFEFHIQHPSSLLMLGVFDYDEGPLELHDPIGRVVIVPTLFEQDTVYTLKYPLHHGETPRGTLTVRLRIHWHNAREASKAQAFVRPPRFIINVHTQRAWRTLRYLTRGSIDMTDVTIESVKLYATEVQEHMERYCYYLDIVATTLLWRGRINIFGFSIWFPLSSIIFFLGAILAVERPEFIPAVGPFFIAYALLCNNYNLSNHPSPWSRIRSFARVVLRSHFASRKKVHIEPQLQEPDAKLLKQLAEYRGLRVMAFLSSAKIAALTLYRVYSKTTPVDISRVSKSGNLISKLYVNYLSYLHLMLRMICKYIRVLRNFVNWRSGSTYKFTSDMLLFAIAWSFFPYKTFVLRNTIRAIIILSLGPHNKVIDVLWLHKHYRTLEDLIRDGLPQSKETMKADIAERPNMLEPVLQSAWVRKMGQSGRIVVEDNLKLQAVRQARYGKFSEAVPNVDSSRFASVPTSMSFAQPYASNESGDTKGSKDTFVDIPDKNKKWSHVQGQKLYGTIVPKPVSVHESTGDSFTRAGSFPMTDNEKDYELENVTSKLN